MRLLIYAVIVCHQRSCCLASHTLCCHPEVWIWFPLRKKLVLAFLSTCVASIQHSVFPAFFTLPSPPLRICSHWVAWGKIKIIKKRPPPTKRTKTWGASEEERPLPLKFRNNNKKMTCSFELAVPWCDTVISIKCAVARIFVKLSQLK